MDLTQGTQEEKQARAKSIMLWIGIVSLFMMFAGLISAYIVSSKRKDWLTEMPIPNIFLVSTLIILISSGVIHMAYKAVKKGDRGLTASLLWLTLLLGVAFIVCQVFGFQALIQERLFFTGSASNPRTSYVYVIAFLHILHVVAGLIVLFVLIYNHYKQRYENGQTLGFELGVTFWHFLDVLWLLLISIFYFI